MFPYKSGLIFCGLLLLAIVLVLLPADFFDGGPAICLSRVLLNLECYACGMTRACMRLIHFRFAEAGEYNRLSYLVMPLLCWVWLNEVFQSGKILLKHYQGNSGTGDAFSERKQA